MAISPETFVKEDLKKENLQESDLRGNQNEVISGVRKKRETPERISPGMKRKREPQYKYPGIFDFQKGIPGAVRPRRYRKKGSAIGRKPRGDAV
jgi:hypothetical protein